MVPSLHDSAIQEATARYELLAQGLASEHDRFLTSHRQAIQMLTRHLEDRTEKSLGAVGMADRQVPGLRSAPALYSRELDRELGRAVEFLTTQTPAEPR